MALHRGTGDWRQVQDDLRAGVYGPWREVVRRVCHELADRRGDDAALHGISSSDVNHVAYSMVRSGELRPQQEVLLAYEMDRAHRRDMADERRLRTAVSGLEGLAHLERPLLPAAQAEVDALVADLREVMAATVRRWD